MKTPEQVLHAFYTFWMSEREAAIAGRTEDNYVTHFGLCTNLVEWLDTINVKQWVWIEAIILQKRKLVIACGDPANVHPFNTCAAEYGDEKSSNTCHLNPHRVAYVQRMIKELAP